MPHVGINPGPLDLESCALPLRFRAPYVLCDCHFKSVFFPELPLIEMLLKGGGSPGAGGQGGGPGAGGPGKRQEAVRDVEEYLLEKIEEELRPQH